MVCQIPYHLDKSECLNVNLCFQEIIFFLLPITKGSVNALMKLAGFSTSNKVKIHIRTTALR